MYNKLFTKILDSSIWLAPMPTRIVWITFLAAMDEDGFVQLASAGNVARRANVTLEEAESGLAELESPDPNSPPDEYEGKRIERVPGGWLVLKAKEHREMISRAMAKDQSRVRMQRYRERLRSSDARVTTSEAEAEAEVRTLPSEGSSQEAGQTLQTLWNEGTHATGLPRCVALSTKRDAHCRRRLQEHPADYWRDAIDRIQGSSFCRGKNDRGWVATFDWLIANADNAIKALEGKYDDRLPVSAPRTAAAAEPAYQDPYVCEHEPTCPNRDWHAMKLEMESAS